MDSRESLERITKTNGEQFAEDIKNMVGGVTVVPLIVTSEDLVMEYTSTITAQQLFDAANSGVVVFTYQLPLPDRSYVTNNLINAKYDELNSVWFFHFADENASTTLSASSPDEFPTSKVVFT